MAWESVRLRRALVAIALCAAAAFGLLALAVSAPWAALYRADRWIATGLHADLAGHPALVEAFRVVTDAGSPDASLAVLALVVFAVLVVRRKRPAAAVLVLAVALVAGALERAVKHLVARPRPAFADPVAHAGGYSFPSGHAVDSFADYALLLAVLLPLLGRRGRRVVVPLVALWVVLIGFTRLALGVHYLSDVAGGWLMAAAWVGGVLAVAAERR